MQSYGVVPLKKEGTIWKVLLVRHVKGQHWGFPKGHKEKEESSQEAALRELKEETGLSVKRFIRKKAITERYIPDACKAVAKKSDAYKTVYYYMAEVEGTLSLQVEEISEARFVDLEEAESLATHAESKHLVKKVRRFFNPWWRRIRFFNSS